MQRLSDLSKPRAMGGVVSPVFHEPFKYRRFWERTKKEEKIHQNKRATHSNERISLEAHRYLPLTH
jgi:hypothetical protein